MSIVIFILVGTLGMIAHWFKKYYRGQTLQSLWFYMFDHKTSTIRAFIGMTVAVIGLVSLGTIELTQQNLALAFLAGGVADSTLNNTGEE